LTAEIRTISVFGLGYVGTVLLGCLARDGHRVIGVDVDAEKLRLLKAGQAPILEEGVQELISDAFGSGRAAVTEDARYGVQNSDVSFICVGTPSKPNGSQDLSALERVVAQVGRVLRDEVRRHLVVVRSTAMPGTVEDVVRPILERESGKKAGEGFGLCFMPEFLREGSSIRDYYNPPFTVVGGDSPRSVSAVQELFTALPGEFIGTSIRSAEMLKYCCNAFHALKITFANEMGRICEVLGADAREVLELACRDRVLNISPAYLKPGFAFGGSCLPKDLRALTHTAKVNDVDVPMLSHVMESNELHVGHAVRKIMDRRARRVGMLGLSFKPGTDDLRESPLVTMAEWLLGKGVELLIYDPTVHLSRLIGANRRYIETTIPHIASLMKPELSELVTRAEVLVVAQNDERHMEELYAGCRSDQLVLDLVGTVDPARLRAEYAGACW
jgi:GDP-mannose 6-dehydrogenase